MISGKGLFVWRADRVLGRMGMDAMEVAMVAKNAGIQHIIIKIADGDQPFPIPDKDPTGEKEQLTEQLIRALENAGIYVWGFSFVYGTRVDIVAQAQIFAQRARQFGIKGLVINAESSWQTASGTDRARQLTQLLRNALPADGLLALSTYRYPSFHPRFPFDAFMEGCDIAMPQVYWAVFNGQEGDAVHNLQKSYEEYKARYPRTVVIPTGAAFGERQPDNSYWSATPRQISRFLHQAKAMDLTAVNFWSWEHAVGDPANEKFQGQELWQAIAEFDYDAFTIEEADNVAGDDTNVELEIGVGDDGYYDGLHNQFPQASFQLFEREGMSLKYAQTVKTPGSAWAAWVPKMAQSGTYEIQVWIPGNHASTRRARYHIHNVVGETEPIVVEVNQSRFFDEWVRLGVYELDASMPHGGHVILTNHTGEVAKKIGFGGMRWKRIVAASLTMPASTIQLADGFDSPVGSTVERAGNNIWPGKWFDFTGFNVLYTVRKERIPNTNQLRDVKAFHTGADLNLPNNNDKHAPLYSCADGEVIFAEERRVWGEIIVIRHDPLAPDADPVYTRYAHMARVDVTAGDRVTRGQQIGLIGEGDPSTPFSAHLHFDICTTNILEQNAGHWPALQQHLVTRHYTDAKAFIEANRPRK